LRDGKEAYVTAAPLLPRNAPFSPEDIDTLNGVVSRTTAQQRSWLAGFFAGYEAAQGGQQLPQAVAPPKARQPLTVLYGSESGNARRSPSRPRSSRRSTGSTRASSTWPTPT
jgi:sulfite reductase (NADPH) flavoprotein alpha-component